MPHFKSTGNPGRYTPHKYQLYIGEFVYGGIDGSITTFAVVAGAAGAGLHSSVVIILGLANLIADGFSMSVGSYLSGKSKLQNYQRHKESEYWEVENIPQEGEEEVRKIFRDKGFSGDLLEKAVAKVISDKDVWVNMMMKEELEMIPDPLSPLRKGLTTFFSFMAIGAIPLLIYLLDYIRPVNSDLFIISAVLTGFTFLLIGWLKTYVTQTSAIRGMAETFFLGFSAAALAYWVGDLLESII